MNEGTWDLSVFYQDFDDPALRGDIDAIRAAAEGMENLLAQDRPEADCLEAMVSCLEDMTNRLTRAYGYAELTLAADTENEGALRLMDELSAPDGRGAAVPEPLRAARGWRERPGSAD